MVKVGNLKEKEMFKEDYELEDIWKNKGTIVSVTEREDGWYCYEFSDTERTVLSLNCNVMFIYILGCNGIKIDEQAFIDIEKIISKNYA